jgi:chemotaxis protein MotA
MLTIGAFVLLLACVFGSYVVSGGSFDVLVEAVPFEMWTIGGSAVGAFIMANSMHDLKHALGNFKKIFGGASFHKKDYVDLLSLLYFLVRLATTKGNMALEPHIEKPEDSPAFQKFPRILANRFASAMICDYLRMVGMNADDPNHGPGAEEDTQRGAARRSRPTEHGGRIAGTWHRCCGVGRDQDHVAY